MNLLQFFPRGKEGPRQALGIISQQLEHIRQTFTSPRRKGKGCGYGRLQQFMEGQKYIVVIEQVVRHFLYIVNVLDGGRVMR